MTEETLFELAVNTPEAERAALLDRECAGNPELRARVESLLRADGRTVEFAHPPTRSVDPNGTRSEAAPATLGEAGQVVAGRYTLVEVIGEGGMGSVWRAKQIEPVKRFVAVKLIKAGMDTKAVLARFEAERQALALMDHPNIAKILDGGVHDNRPFFVMELVKGTPITEFCDARRLTPQQRLELFVPVCNAIQHAHQKGIIHRDIKPSNVLVALYDDQPVVKVIDFGVAKATGGTLTEKTIDTGFGGVVGTPQYMSPEQATFNNLDIDTRTDVYALGVLLYELLAGSPPFSRVELEKRGLLEILRVVREEEPPRPSTKLSTSEAKPSISANRGIEPAKLAGLLKGELDWIVMRALEKDRTRRYDTANAFAADVQRYLAGEAVSACPPTLGYRLKKAYRRNRAAVMVGLMFTLLLLTGAAVASLLAVQARRAEALAEEKRIEAEEQRQKAERLFVTNSSTQEAYLEAAVEAEIRNNSSRLDADLLEYKSDARVGLLRLARPLKDGIGPIKSDFPLPNAEHFMGFGDNPELVKLREFQAAAVITAGQEFVPLVPPLDPTISSKPSRDERWFLAGDERTGIELLAIPSLKRIGILREDSERLVNWGFSPDSKTCWTQDTDSVVRFWNTDGSFRAKTPLRPERFVYPAGMSIEEVRRVAFYANYVDVKDGVALVQSGTLLKGRSGTSSSDWGRNGDDPQGPTDLYSTRTGQFLRRVELPVRLVIEPHWRRSHYERWIMFMDRREMPGGGWRDEAYIIVSADDGQELARLVHPGGKDRLRYRISPFGKWVLTSRGEDFVLWSSANWTPDDDVGRRLKSEPNFNIHVVDFVTDDVLELGTDGAEAQHHGLLHLKQPELRASGITIGASPPAGIPLISEFDGTLIRCGRVLTNATTLQRLNPPPGRKYAPELAKLAPDGRFFEDLDTITEKRLPVEYGELITSITLEGKSYINGTSLFETAYDPELRFRPDAKRLTIPPAMLELWAQVVTGGELGSDDRFVPWDEPTWLAKQKQLAAMTPPYNDFPFPGWVTQDPHVWWWVQTRRLNGGGKEWDRLMAEWRRRSGRVRPDLGPDTWRTPGPVRELAPLPRVVK